MSASCPELFNSTLNAGSAKKKAHGAGAAVGEPIFSKMGRGDWNQQSALSLLGSSRPALLYKLLLLPLLQ
jgi:DNA-nicking Smr family endonuclease